MLINSENIHCERSRGSPGKIVALAVFVAVALLALPFERVFAEDDLLIVTISSKNADSILTVDLRAYSCEQIVDVNELSMQVKQVESWVDIEICDLDNDGCYDDFLILARSPGMRIDKVDWYKIVGGGNLEFQGTLLESAVRVKELLALSSGDIDGDANVDILIVEVPAVLGDGKLLTNRWLGHYKFDPETRRLISQGEITVPVESKRYLLETLDIGDWNGDGTIDILTVELDWFIRRSHHADDPNDLWDYAKDDLKRVRRYHYSNDPNEPLVFDEELLVTQRWIHELKDIEIGRLDEPNDFEAFVVVDGMFYDSSSALVQWRRYNGEMVVSDFPLITIPVAERFESMALATTALCKRAYGNVIERYPRGDANKDCTSNLLDLGVISEFWEITDMCGHHNGWCEGSDTDKDGSVSLSDVVALANGWLECTDFKPECGLGFYAREDTEGQEIPMDLTSPMGMLQDWMGDGDSSTHADD